MEVVFHLKTKVELILAMTTFMLQAGWYCLQLLLKQLHGVSCGGCYDGWCGVGPTHYVVTPNLSQVELCRLRLGLGCDKCAGLLWSRPTNVRKQV